MATFMFTLLAVTVVFVFGDNTLFNAIQKMHSFMWSPCMKITVVFFNPLPEYEPELEEIDLEFEVEDTESWDLDKEDDEEDDLDTAEVRRAVLEKVFAGHPINVGKQNNTFIASLDYSQDSEGNYKPSSVKWYPSIQTGVIKDRGTRSTWFVMP